MKISIPQYKDDPLASILEFFHIFAVFYIPVGPVAVVGLIGLIKGDTSSINIQMTIGAWIVLILIILGRYYMITNGYRDSVIFDYFENLFEKHRKKDEKEVISNASENCPTQGAEKYEPIEKTEYSRFFLFLLSALPYDDMNAWLQYSSIHGNDFRRSFDSAISQLKAVCPYPTNIDNVSLRSMFSLTEDCHPKITRGFLFLEDSDWEKADQYFESVLDEDPTNSYAYIGKLMVDDKIASLDELEKSKVSFEENKNYQKAIRFADNVLSEKLKTLNASYVPTPRKYAVQTPSGIIWITQKVAETILYGKINDAQEFDKEDTASLQLFVRALMNQSSPSASLVNGSTVNYPDNKDWSCSCGRTNNCEVLICKCGRRKPGYTLR